MKAKKLFNYEMKYQIFLLNETLSSFHLLFNTAYCLLELYGL